MNRRFNLLPARYVERTAERRMAGLAAAGLGLLVLVLALASLVQARQLALAETRRDTEQARTGELLARRRALAPFRQLADGIVGRERLLASAMESQVSWSKVLTSLSTTFPAGASLTSLTAESSLPPFGASRPLKPGAEELVIGSTTFNGYSVESFTPGVDRMLQLLDGVGGLSGPRLQVGAVEEIGGRRVTTFDGVTFLDGVALAGRYANGLPPERDVDVPRAGGRSSSAAAVTSAARPSQ